MHQFSRTDFDALIEGAGDLEMIARLRCAERSKHILLLRGVLDKAVRAHPAAYDELELADAWQLLREAQEHAPNGVAELLTLPQIGAWAVDCLRRMSADEGADPAVRTDLAHFCAIAASAGLHARIAFDLPVMLRDGRLDLPGLGIIQTSLRCEHARLRHSVPGLALLTAGAVHTLPSSWQRPWRLTVSHAGIVFDVHVDAIDPYFDRFGHQLLRRLDEWAMAAWRDRFAGAWRILATHHSGDAEAIAAGLRTVVPLAPEKATHVISATSASAFGALATSLPPDDLTLAETLVHEFQHQKLCALVDLVPLLESDDHLYYAPWRDDPRPLPGLLQGAYAYLGVTRFWRTQRLCVPVNQALRGHVEFARRRTEVLAVTRTLLASGRLTEAGIRFVTCMRDRLLCWRRERVPENARRIAGELTADHTLTWRLRHIVIDPRAVDLLVASWRRGKAPSRAVLQHTTSTVRPAGRSSPHAREILLALRYTDSSRFRRWLAQGSLAMPDGSVEPATLLEVSSGDLALLRDDLAAAITAYRTEIREGTAIDGCTARPETWAGLALAVQGLGGAATYPLADRTPLLFALHIAIHRATGESADPLDLAAWVADGRVTFPAMR
jgi:HEXXH motif-containing protein